MPNIGRTLIEKFEDYSNVGFVVVLLTPDDLGTSKDKREELKPRARQNVIFELGFFVGKLGRERVCVLYKENVEIPSDYEGMLYVKMDKSDGWKAKLAREMKEVGIKIDPVKLLY
jgi:predicted nucleotide-binding protein